MSCVAICVATCRRPRGLTRLLRALDVLSLAYDPGVAVSLVIVDNDPARAAPPSRAALDADCRWPIQLLVEDRRGIAFARNAAVRVAREQGIDLLAFIDDDEVPEPRWLDELLRVMAEFKADVVTGPVLPLFEVDPPAWILRGRFFDRPRHTTGTCLRHARTGNALVRLAVLDGLAAPFDERRALSGGEDTHLFVRLVDAGRRIVWADEALVYEWNPATRLNTSWLLRRAFRGSAIWCSIESEFRPGLGTRMIRVAKAIGRIVQGAVLLPIGVMAGRHLLVQSLRTLSIGVGSLAGMLGLRYDEYRDTRGD